MTTGYIPAVLRVALALCVALLLVPAAAIGSFRTGIYLDRAEVRGTNADLASSRIAAAGASVVRLSVTWSDAAPKEIPVGGWDPTSPDDPNYTWGTIDVDVRAVVAKGLTPLLTIAKAPAWAETRKHADGAYLPSPKAFADFATAVARRFDGTHGGLPAVRYWQAWNEPNISPYLQPQYTGAGDVAPGWYRKMLNAFAIAVHGVSPRNLVVAGGLSPFTVSYSNAKSIGPLKFMRELFCLSAGDKPQPVCRSRTQVDIWATHPYTSGGPFHKAARPNDVSLGDLPRMKALLDAAKETGQLVSARQPEFWVTEFSWDTNPPDPQGLPVALHARWTAEALHQMWLSGVDTVIWLMLRDDPYPSSPLQAGLYYRGETLPRDRPKPALAAFRFPFVAYLRTGSVDVWGRAPGGRRTTALIEKRVGASWQRVSRFVSGTDGVFNGAMVGSFLKTDSLRARAGSHASPTFSLTQPRDRSVHPFG